MQKIDKKNWNLFCCEQQYTKQKPRHNDIQMYKAQNTSSFSGITKVYITIKCGHKTNAGCENVEKDIKRVREREKQRAMKMKKKTTQWCRDSVMHMHSEMVERRTNNLWCNDMQVAFGIFTLSKLNQKIHWNEKNWKLFTPFKGFDGISMSPCVWNWFHQNF